ncbi:MAG: hypothetical protein ACRCZI_14145 [Cetobacterium sp.]
MKDLLNSLDELQNLITTPATVNLEVLLNKKFMKKYTNFNSLDELLNLCNIKDDDDLDDHIVVLNQAIINNSEFENYDDMLEAAACEYQEKKIDKIFK